MKGDFYDSSRERELRVYQDSFCVVEEGESRGIYSSVPEKYKGISVVDHSGKIIIPGLVDLHLHAPQYQFRGMGMDMELLQWLYEYTFPEESRYADAEYARKAYGHFVDDMIKSATTRAVIFGTIHTDSTLLLMEMLEQTGLVCYVGKVNMDRNASEYYIESAEESVEETRRFIREAQSRFRKVKPILTPRFIPTCTDELMEELSVIQKETGIPVQSHLSENRSEIRWVQELCPDAEFYGDAYDRFGLFGRGCRTIMAHCVSSSEKEIERIRTNGVYIAHCPNSNMNLSSGIAPVRKFLDRGIPVGLGTDVAAGYCLSVFQEMVSAIQASKMRWRYVDEIDPLTVEEVFYMATRGGGSFFGHVGSFEKGYEFDAVVVDDSRIRTSFRTNAKERLERMICLSAECVLEEKYVNGENVLRNIL